jgi:hypothetical protein
MRLTMDERKTVTKALAEQYRRGAKKDKGRLLDEFVQATGYNRVYAARLLRNFGVRREVAPGLVVEASHRGRWKGPRRRQYGPEVLKPLKKIWKIQDYPCGKRLAAALPEVLARLVAFGELRVSKGVQGKLQRISAATMDRLLKPERDKMALKHRGGTKPGTVLKSQIPVRTFADWNEQQPGFLEVDLVGHDGGCGYGEFCQTLNATDVATGWTEQRAVPTKAQRYVFEALQALRESLPFALRGLDSDNGGEFINHQLYEYCVQEEITFTRSRSNRKNDNCFVEQKNWSIVRRFVGYGRYESPEALACLNELYAALRDYVNFFQPSMKLVEKTRNGSRVTRRYDKPTTPYHRVLASPEVAPAVKRRLTRHYQTLNPAQLHRTIQRLQKKLLTLTPRRSAALEHKRAQQAARVPKPNHPWRRTGTSSRRPPMAACTSTAMPPPGEAAGNKNNGPKPRPKRPRKAT